MTLRTGQVGLGPGTCREWTEQYLEADWLCRVRKRSGGLWGWVALSHAGSHPLTQRIRGWGRGGRVSLAKRAVCFRRMVLCIAANDSHSLSRLSLRFGASLKSCRHLLENAKKSCVEVVGVR